MSRFRAFALVLAAAALVAGGQAGSVSASRRTVSAGTVRTAINSVRHRYGLHSLRASWRLARAADQHSRKMGSGYFEHSSADGTAFWKRIQRYFGSSGYREWSVGENLL